MAKKDKQKNKERQIPRINKFLNRRSTIVFLFIFVCLIGLPLKVQNIRLNGYISDDAWWHFRQIDEVVQLGHRLNPDIYEFTTLARPMTYPPLFHYLVASGYKLLGAGLPLAIFTHYFNFLEGMLYLLLIYWLSCVITNDKLFSLIGALGASVSYGIIIRARAGELMPFVLSDLLALAGLLFLLILLKNINHPRRILYCWVSGILFGLSMLAWSGAIFIYVPLILFVFLALSLSNPSLTKTALKLFGICLIAFLITCSHWYIPIIAKYGLNPHSKEMDWFMKGFTVLHQVKPLNFYIFTTGIPIFFVPIVFLSSLFKKDAVNIFLLFWIILTGIATYSGWRGYVAVAPIVSAVAISVGVSRIIRYLFKEWSSNIAVSFIILFLLVGGIGYNISSVRLKPLDPSSANEVRTHEKSIKMLETLKEKYPKAITIDHITWISEDAAVGRLKMVGGQYLEYLPKGSSDVLKDISLIYLSDEETAFRLCQKYDVGLIIVRKQMLQLPQLSILFAPPGLKSDDYFKVTKKFPESEEVTINFSPRGLQMMLFRMLNRHELKHFELVYSDQYKNDPLPFVVVYKVKK